MTEKFIIRAGSHDDAAEMARIYNHYVACSDVIFSNRILSADDMRQKLERLDVGSRFPFLIAEYRGHTAGYVYAHSWQPDPVYDATWEITIYLDHECCGMGIGTALLQHVIDDCQRKGAHVLISCITEGNKACERMFGHAGFTRSGCLPETGYKFGRYLNDVLYYRILDRD